MVPVGPGWPKEDDVTYLQGQGWVSKCQGEVQTGERACEAWARRHEGLQLRLELGNVVTGEGEREGRVVVGD